MWTREQEIVSEIIRKVVLDKRRKIYTLQKIVKFSVNRNDNFGD